MQLDQLVCCLQDPFGTDKELVHPQDGRWLCGPDSIIEAKEKKVYKELEGFHEESREVYFGISCIPFRKNLFLFSFSMILLISLV